MINQVTTYSDNPFYNYDIWFEDDQSYYRAVMWMRDEYGRAASYCAKSPKWTYKWTYNPDRLIISLRQTADALDFLVKHNWKITDLWIGELSIFETHRLVQLVHKWCEERGYLSLFRSECITICVPTDKDLLISQLKFSEFGYLR